MENNEKNVQNKAKLPKIFIVLLVLAPIFLAGGIIMIVFGSMNSISDPALMGLGMFLLFLAIVCFMFGLIPIINKVGVKTAKYLQENNKEDLKDIASGTADITSGAVTKTTKAIKQGLKNTKFCKYCGAEIDAEANFCSKCGKDLR